MEINEWQQGHQTRFKAKKKNSLFHVVGLFLEVVGRSRTNACPDQAVKTVCWFFSEVVVRSRTNVCPDQGLKTLC